MCNFKINQLAKSTIYTNMMRQVIKQLIVLLLVTSTFDGFCQNNEQHIMKSFIPKNGAYDIYYPKSFSINENSQGIVTISDSVSKLNITVSSYLVDKKMNDRKLIEQLNLVIKDYYKKELNVEDWNSYKTKFEILIETKFSANKINWVWYGIVNKQRLVTISLNKETNIDDEDTNLIRFMIDNLLINH